MCRQLPAVKNVRGRVAVSCHGVTFEADERRAAAAWNRYQIEMSDYRKGGRMKKKLVALLLLSLCGTAGAWDVSKNPDQVPSIGWGLHSGKLPGFATDYARFTAFNADFKMPVNNYLSLTVDFQQTTVGNAQLGVPTTANRIGAELRVYLHDLK
jgi:hypothetical protein